MPIDQAAVEQTLEAARTGLLAARVAGGYWTGELSSSALSTATAVCALELLDRATRGAVAEPGGEVDLPGLVRGGLAWLAEHQNPDGGWGDTADSPSNVSTTALCWAALGVNEQAAGRYQPVADRAEAWLKHKAGDLTAPALAHTISAAYGKDRTFAVPILTMCALAGRFGTGRHAWRSIPALPFELAAFPRAWLRWVGLGVVSYALPALIAVGQARHHHRPTSNPLTRCLRRLTRERTLRVLRSIQPASGGFLEAAPLTSFVVMSMVSVGQHDHPVVRQGTVFLARSVRPDGSWPIDTNLATWVTTLSVNALAQGQDGGTGLSADDRARLRAWLLGQQYRSRHPYTDAAAGGWAWTDLTGGVPDADDTAGALLALRHLAPEGQPNNRIGDELRRTVASGVRWLLDLQNKDGGIPTFCRDWGKLPFDHSSPDLTAHTLRAWHAWRDCLADDLRRRVERATGRAIRYLVRMQGQDGSWVPLWFGNQHHPGHKNPLYGTTRVLRAGEVPSPDARLVNAWLRARERALDWVLAAQNSDGGWGGAVSLPSSIEETALAVEALAGPAHSSARNVVDATARGCAWLVEHTTGGTRFGPAPIGLYFAKLWYYERLYPLIFTVSALERVCRPDTRCRR